MNPRIFLILLLIVAAICLFSNFAVSDNDQGPHPYDFKYPEAFGKPILPADNPMTVEGVWLGRLLFYDSILSINRKMSCASCHQQKLSFTDGRALAVGTFGDTLTRNTMSVVNMAWSEYYFWDGRVRSLEGLVKEPISAAKEMGGLTENDLVQRLKAHPYYPALFKAAFPKEEISMATVSKAVAQFVRSIVSKMIFAPEKVKGKGNYVVVNGEGVRNFSDLINEDSHAGLMARVVAMHCKSCHTTDLYGGKIMTVYENDSMFKVPNLTNARYTAPYMHDGRFKTAREVVQFYSDSTEAIMAKNPQILLENNDFGRTGALVHFRPYDLDHADEVIQEVEDTSVMTNPLFSNPFGQKGFTWKGIKDEGQNK